MPPAGTNSRGGGMLAPGGSAGAPAAGGWMAGVGVLRGGATFGGATGGGEGGAGGAADGVCANDDTVVPATIKATATTVRNDAIMADPPRRDLRHTPILAQIGGIGHPRCL